jgi:hypothetical protein
MMARGFIVALVLASVAAGAPVQPVPQDKVMSVHNRLLLNRLAVNGHETLQVMLLVENAAFRSVLDLVPRLHGRVRRAEEAVGYIRAELPVERLTELAADLRVQAYQISSLSKGAWYRDAAPELNARMFRGFEVRPVAASAPELPPSNLPELTPGAARGVGYSADDDVGVGAWLARHPTFDGRGVTIAMLESAQAEFAHPALGTARTLDGAVVPKIAGILNATDPEDPDDTRVDLATEIRASSAWVQIGGRTYIVPGPGTYRFGVFHQPAGSNLVERFGVLRRDGSGELRVDTDGDDDFQEESAITDVNKAFNEQTVHRLQLKYPRATQLAFVMAEGNMPSRVHIYTARSAHMAMTIGVAAGSRLENGPARGVAPGARILLVRNSISLARLHTFFEGYLEAIKRPDVDVLCASAGLMMLPDTAHDFAGSFFTRLIATYDKPIFQSAGNSLRLPSAVVSLGDVFSVGGALSPASYNALFGGGHLDADIVHPVSAGGPAFDGAIKPDFLAPENVVAPGLLMDAPPALLPRNNPVSRLPRGYTVSCCTSASAPYAAGIAALLVSAARQQHVAISVASLGRALRASARFLPGWPAHQQGNGLLDVSGAWRELQRMPDLPRIRAVAANVHALAMYAAAGPRGEGLYEREGWRAGSTGTRVLRLVRESGGPAPRIYRVAWIGNDGTFSSPGSIALPLGTLVAFPLSIAVAESGLHSAIVSLIDPGTGTTVFRTAVTIVAAEHFATPSWMIRFSGSLSLLRTADHFMMVPAGVAAISVELEVLRGAVSAVVLPAHGLNAEYYDHLIPQAARTFAKGKYSVLLPRPRTGTWSMSISNISAWLERDETLRSYEPAAYAVTVKLLSTDLDARTTPEGVRIDVTNLAAEIRERAIDVSVGRLRSHEALSLPTGLPNQFTIDVPEGARTLALQLRALRPSASLFELHLFDCTSGECFSYDFTMPAASADAIVVNRPKAGRWVAAVNAAPMPRARHGFVLDEIITTRKQRVVTSPGRLRASGRHSTETFGLPGAQPAGTGTPVIVCELVDLALERDLLAYPWETRKGQPTLADREIAVGAIVLQRR